MYKETKLYIIISIVIIVVYFFVNSYTTELFNVNEYNRYTINTIENNSQEDVARNFVNLLLEDNFSEAYNLLNDKTKDIFKSHSELKEYFYDNFKNINRNEDGIFILENYIKVDNRYNIYNYTIVSTKYDAPKDYDMYYAEMEFNVFDSITIYEISPIDYKVQINI